MLQLLLNIFQIPLVMDMVANISVWDFILIQNLVDLLSVYQVLHLTTIRIFERG